MALVFPEIKYYTFDKNFKMMFLKLPSNIFSCNITVEVGSVDEDHSKEEMGLAHFFEHMILKGYIDGVSITERLDFIGAHYNATTSYIPIEAATRGTLSTIDDRSPIAISIK